MDAMKEQLNGSADRLAAALRDVVREAASEAIEATEERLGARISESEERLNTRISGLATDVRESEERLNSRLDRAVEDIVAERQSERVT